VNGVIPTGPVIRRPAQYTHKYPQCWDPRCANTPPHTHTHHTHTAPTQATCFAQHQHQEPDPTIKLKPQQYTHTPSQLSLLPAQLSYSVDRRPSPTHNPALQATTLCVLCMRAPHCAPKISLHCAETGFDPFEVVRPWLQTPPPHAARPTGWAPWECWT
jgi:hypothetical protein